MDIETLKQQCLECQKCELSKTRNHVVFGAGNAHADIMFIGEAPGKNEDLEGEPFVGRAGMLLNDFLMAFGFERKDVFIGNIVKCRPPQNRDPLPEEQDLCIDWLKAQIRLIDPKIIVCLGRIAACRIIDKDFKITAQHGEIFERGSRGYMATFHPAALLRNPRYKDDTYRDFEKLVAYIEKTK